MKIISAIYRRVRHHLHDDWAYGNDLDAKPRDFQQQECILKSCIEKFNSTYYDSQAPVSTVVGESPSEGGGLGASAPGVGGDSGALEEDDLLDKSLNTNYLSILGQKVRSKTGRVVKKGERVGVCGKGGKELTIIPLLQSLY